MESEAKRQGSIRWYLFGILVALELLMSFSFLGYFHVEPISITTAYIPVLLAGALLGPLESMAVGTVFGLASMWKASASYVMPFDRLFSPVMSGHPVESVLLSVGSRALFGFLIGVLYCGAKKGKRPGIWIAVVSFFGRTIHSTLVYSAMWAFFPEAGYTPLNTAEDFFTFNNMAANLLSTGLVVIFWHIVHTRTWNQFVQRLEVAKTAETSERYHILSLIGIVLLAVFSSVAVALYFVQRMVSVLQQKGVVLPDEGYNDIVHLQIQFLFGILAMMALVTIFLALNRRYNTYMRREAKTDTLTGAMNRRAFFQSCNRILNRFDFQEDASGYFVMVDMDRFKEINDVYGHPEGDRVLKEAVLAMSEVFGGDGLIGRVGGDEFAIFVCIPTNR